MLTATGYEVPLPKYRRLDMAKLPPYRLEKITEKEWSEKYSFLDLFSPIQYKNIWNDETEAKRAEDEQKSNPYSFNWFRFAFIGDNYIPQQWQKPIPPAFQKRHEEYEETHVKPSRIWIEMTGDHKHYTNDFRLVILIENEADDGFDVRERTEYENRVQEHWEMMRKVIWDDTPIRSSRDRFHIIRSPPPSYEQAIYAVKFLESLEATKAAAGAKEKDNTEFEEKNWECEKEFRKTIGKYIQHQRL